MTEAALVASNLAAPRTNSRPYPTGRDGAEALRSAAFGPIHGVRGAGLSPARAQFVAAFLATTCIIFFAARAMSGGIDGWAHQAVRLVNLSLLVAITAALSATRPLLSPERAVLLASSISMLCSALVCTLEGDTVNTSIAAIALTLGTASFIPWAMRDQLILVLVAAIGVVANQVWIGVNGPVETITVASAMLTFGATLMITRTLEQSREKGVAEERLRLRAEAELRLANRLLEDRVRERTAESRAAVEELRAFTYSVSHDLRSPLRAINGMTQMLEDEHASVLDGSAIDYMTSVKQASRRMDRLIDALLARSRVGQAELHRGPIDLGALGDTVVADLRGSDPGRQVEWIRTADLTVSADRTLSAVVLQHLIANAWKFTRDVDHARIELGAARRGPVTEFFVRDNGEGFPMEHAGKLFENFQRLHGDDYEGTGIGLATVRCIAERHGGSVRFDSEPGRGTTVWFTLERVTA